MGHAGRYLATGMVAFGLTAPAAAAIDCTGVHLTVGAMTPPFIGGPAIAHGRTWEGSTGGKVNVLTFPFSELYTKFMAPMALGQHGFDVILYPPAWQGDFAPYLADVPDAVRQDADFADIHPTYRDRLMTLDGRMLSVTIDGDVHAGSYRRDLFESPENKAGFKEIYGYDLAPPETWEQYYDIAAFFSRPESNLYGTAEAFARGGQQFWFFFSHAAAFTNHPDHPGSMFFDPETMDAQIANPGWVKALEDYAESLRLAPPGALSWDAAAMRTAFAEGRLAMNLDWGDTGTIAADATRSKVAGDLGFFVLPGSKTIWNPETNAWDSFDEVIHSPFMAYGGWMASVPSSSLQQPCAWSYVTWYGNRQNSTADMVTGGTGINPYRLSHFENVDPWLKVFTREEAEAFLEVQRASIESDNLALDFRLPGYFQYVETLETQLTKVLSGNLKPQEALENVAAEWNRLTDEFGRDNQRLIYRASMGLPPL